MAMILRFRRLKHGAPQKMRLLGDAVGRRRRWPGFLGLAVVSVALIAALLVAIR